MHAIRATYFLATVHTVYTWMVPLQCLPTTNLETTSGDLEYLGCFGCLMVICHTCGFLVLFPMIPCDTVCSAHLAPPWAQATLANKNKQTSEATGGFALLKSERRHHKHRLHDDSNRKQRLSKLCYISWGLGCSYQKAPQARLSISIP